jgi:UDP-N-acetyl-2-amino-2-deoxyglucuronate dehydrogenase
MGPVVEVAAYSGLLAHERIEVEDTAAAVLRFEGGAIGTIVATTAASPGLSARIAVNGDRGSAVIDDDQLTYFHAADAYGGGENQADEVLKRYGGPSTAPGARP